MRLQERGEGCSISSTWCFARCVGHIKNLIKAWKRLGLNIKANGGVCVEVEKESELQAFHESLSEDPQEK